MPGLSAGDRLDLERRPDRVSQDPPGTDHDDVSGLGVGAVVHRFAAEHHPDLGIRLYAERDRS